MSPAPTAHTRAETIAPAPSLSTSPAPAASTTSAATPVAQTLAQPVARSIEQPAERNDADELLRAWAAPQSSSTPKTAAATTTAAIAPALLGKDAAAWKLEPQRRWEQFVDLVRIARPLLASILEHARPGSAEFTPGSGGELELHFATADTYYRDQVQSRVYVEQLSALGSEFFGEPIRFKLELRDTETASGATANSETIAARKDRLHREREDAARDAARNHPILAEARSLFGGELSPIELLPADNGGAHA